MKRSSVYLLLCGLAIDFLLPCIAAAQQNTIYDELLQKGISLANGQIVKLPEPTMADGLGSADQNAILVKLARPPRPKDFPTGSISAPFTLEINDVTGNPGQSVGRRVDLYFVAKGKLSWVADKDFMQGQVKKGNGNANGGNNCDFLTDKELQDRKLTVIDNNKLKERYAHADLDLFGMVKVSGTGHAMESFGTDSVYVAFILDPLFKNDPQFPNQWQAITRNPAGQPVLGAPQAYAGAGAYVKATALVDQPDRVFIEYHLVFDEPFGWWQNKTVLKVKLPNKYEDDVRNFRRDLINFGKKQIAAAPAASNNPPAANNTPAAASPPAKDSAAPTKQAAANQPAAK